MAEKPKENWGSAGPYERYVGRWSRQVARQFIDWISVSAGRAWADVGCGTGALAECVLANSEPRSIAAVDRAEGFVAAARRNVTDPRASFDTADATALPWNNAEFDAAVSGLVLNFVLDHKAMASEMARVTKPGGKVALYVWDYGRGMEMMRHFWDWTGGFWAGLLWLAYYRSRDEMMLRQAEYWADRLRPRMHAQSVFRGFLFYYGAAIGAILLDKPIGLELGLLGAQELATLYNSRARVIPIGTQAARAQESHLRETNIDCVALVALLGWAAEKIGNEKLRQIGRAHAARHVELCVRDDGSVHQSARFDALTGKLTTRFTHKGYSDEST